VAGRDITVVLPLAPWEAALGASVAIDVPGGEARIRVPPGTSSGRRLRLRGGGLPNPQGRPGDLYAEARIMIPAKLTDAERRLVEGAGRDVRLRPAEEPVSDDRPALEWVTYAVIRMPSPSVGRADITAFSRSAGMHRRWTAGWWPWACWNRNATPPAPCGSARTRLRRWPERTGCVPASV
jgi:hypothetical protein